MIGVETMPPSLPRLVTVIVEPDSSSLVALPLRAASETRLISSASSHSVQGLGVAHHRHLQAVRRLRGHAGVHGAVPHDHVALGVEPGVALRVLLEHARQRRDQERQVGERRGARRQPSVQVLAQRLELGDVDFLDVGEVRDVALGVGHAVGDHAPHADDLDLVGAGASRQARRGPRRAWACRLPRGAAAPVSAASRSCAGDAPARAAAVHLREVDARLARATARRRRGHDAPALDSLSRPARATGWRRGLGRGLGAGCRSRTGAGAAAGGAAPPRAPARPPARSHRPRSRTRSARRRRGTMSPGPPVSDTTRPVTGAGTSTAAFSVMTSAMTWSSSTWSPTLTCHATISASTVPSPRSGILNT